LCLLVPRGTFSQVKINPGIGKTFIKMSLAGLAGPKTEQIESNNRFQYPSIDGTSQAISEMSSEGYSLFPG